MGVRRGAHALKGPKSAAAAAAGLAAALAGCAVGPSYHRPPPPQAPDYGTASAPATNAAGEGPAAAAQRLDAGAGIPGEWWTLFESQKLDALIERSLRGNPNLAAAQAALRQAQELYRAQRASLLPAVQGGFDAQRARNPIDTLANPTDLPQVNPYYNLFTAQLSLSYSPDVFGGTRRSLEAARAGVAATRFQLIAAYVTLTSNVVVTAVAEGSLRGQLAATRRALELERELTATLRQQRALGTASDLELLAQQTAEAQTAAQLPPLEKQLGQARDALTALLGRLPSQEPPESFELADLTLPAQLPVSLPSQLIEQRPDVRAAEENLHAASAEAGVALAAMLPQFSISADTGSAALAIGRLFTPYTGFWDLGASLTQTLFDAGALIHRHRAADAALDAAAAEYRAAVVLACQNVADTLRALRADADALAADDAAAAAARRTFGLARQQFALGTISQVALLNAELNYRQAEVALVQARANRYADTAGLFQALGGGWWNRSEASFK
ncbi:MAG TPA: efflux transporter outer membrane subunit [Steroidobacteraceae bacterium]|nr:efflux transporter outer membrane subunit [Steroidobacteraceae bacterium]